jgi:hypothetical protein
MIYFFYVAIELERHPQIAGENAGFFSPPAKHTVTQVPQPMINTLRASAISVLISLNGFCPAMIIRFSLRRMRFNYCFTLFVTLLYHHHPGLSSGFRLDDRAAKNLERLIRSSPPREPFPTTWSSSPQ